MPYTARPSERRGQHKAWQAGICSCGLPGAVGGDAGVRSNGMRTCALSAGSPHRLKVRFMLPSGCAASGTALAARIRLNAPCAPLRQGAKKGVGAGRRAERTGVCLDRIAEPPARAGWRKAAIRIEQRRDGARIRERRAGEAQGVAFQFR